MKVLLSLRNKYSKNENINLLNIYFIGYKNFPWRISFPGQTTKLYHGSTNMHPTVPWLCPNIYKCTVSLCCSCHGFVQSCKHAKFWQTKHLWHHCWPCRIYSQEQPRWYYNPRDQNFSIVNILGLVWDYYSGLIFWTCTFSNPFQTTSRIC